MDNDELVGQMMLQAGSLQVMQTDGHPGVRAEESFLLLLNWSRSGQALGHGGDRQVT